MPEPEADELRTYYNDNLNQKQNRAIDMIVQGTHTDKEIANEIEVDRKTIWKWKNDKEFSDEIKYRKKQHFEEIFRRATSLSLNALELMEIGIENAKEFNDNSNIVETAKDIVSIGEKVLKTSGLHGESIKEYLEELQQQSDTANLTDEEREILKSIRMLDAEEIEALGNILVKYDKDELLEKAGLGMNTEAKEVESDGDN